jgi:hypothetical protein
MQPNNEEIIRETVDAEKYLRELLERLITLNATPQTLSNVVQALEIINRCYNDSPNLISGYIGHSYSPSQDISPLALKQIQEAVRDEMKKLKDIM